MQNIKNIKTKRSRFKWIILISLMLIGFFGYTFRGPLGEFYEFIIQEAALVRITRIDEQEKEIAIDVEYQDPELLIEEADVVKIYEETAKPGEGITHLARRALSRYLEGNEQKMAELTPEHKVYIEDWLQNRKGYHWLEIGDTITFSEDLIREAIESSLELTDNQLENLKQFTTSVNR